MKIGKVVNLSGAEEKIATFLGKQRYNKARAKGIPDERIGPHETSPEESDIEAVAAEIAFCKLFNVYPDLQIGERPIHDCILHDGTTVDVKQTHYPRGRLLVSPGKELKNKTVDVYALMVGYIPTFYFKGFLRAEDMLQSWRLKDYGHGPGYSAEQSELKEDHNAGDRVAPEWPGSLTGPSPDNNTRGTGREVQNNGRRKDVEEGGFGVQEARGTEDGFGQATLDMGITVSRYPG